MVGEMRDEQEFEQFVDARTPGLLRHAYLLCGDAGRAISLVETGLAAAYRSWDGDASAAGAAARRAVVVALLRRQSRPRPASRPPAGRGEVADVVWRALAGLPIRRRVVLVLRYADGLADPEIAALLRVRADVVGTEAAAGLTALGRLLRDRGRLEELLPAALAAVEAPPVDTAPSAGRPAADGAGARVVGSRLRAADVVARVRRERRHRQVVRTGWVTAVVVVAGLAVAVPATLGAGRGSGDGPVPAGTPAADAVRRGLLGWPARGELTGDQQLLRSALAAWQSDAADAERPREAVSVLYAGEVGGARLVLLQGVDTGGRARVAEITGFPGASGLRVTRTDVVVPDIPVLAVPDGAGAPAESSAAPAAAPAADPAAAALPGRLRLLTAPDAGEIYLRQGNQPAATPLRELERDGSGLSAPFDSAGNTYVVVLPPPAVDPAGGPPAGSAGPAGGSGADPAGEVADTGGSGLVSTARLTAAPDGLRYAVPTLPVTGPAVPTYGWYADGKLLAGALRGAATVAPLGPRFRWAVKAGPARGHEFQSQSYEVFSGGQRLLSVVTRLDGRVVCADTTRLSVAAATPKVPLSVSRCVAPRYGAGVVQVLAAPGTAKVTVTIVPNKPKQVRYVTPFQIPAGAPASTGFVAAGLIEAGYPTGAGKADAASAAGIPAGRALLAPYHR
jgi:DNA-directed RNA polymerase specialized sigma24 family protein